MHVWLILGLVPDVLLIMNFRKEIVLIWLKMFTTTFSNVITCFAVGVTVLIGAALATIMAQGIIGAFCVRVPLVMLFNKIGNGSLFIIGLATPASSVVQIILCIIALVYYSHSDRRKEC